MIHLWEWWKTRQATTQNTAKPEGQVMEKAHLINI